MLYESKVEYEGLTINHVQACGHGCTYPCYAMMLMKRTGRVESYADWCRPPVVDNALELPGSIGEEHSVEMASWVSIASSAVVAAATVAYVILTRMILAESRRLRRSQAEPRVLVYAEIRTVAVVDLVVHNVGTGPAYAVQFSLKQDFQILEDARLSEIGFLRQGIHLLGPGQKYRTLLAFPSRKDLMTSTLVEVSADYKDVYGTQYHDEFRVDLQAFENIRPGTTPAERMAEAAPKLAEELKGLNRNLADLKTATDHMWGAPSELSTTAKIDSLHKRLRGGNEP